HLERARPFIAAGLPTYVDKPFAASLAAARELAHLGPASTVQMCSASSLRYAPDVARLAREAPALGGVVGCDATSPGSLHPRNPGLYHYGIHGVETLYALMG